MARSVAAGAGAGVVPVVPLTCVPVSLQCVDGDVYTCDDSGTSAMLTKDCGDYAHCRTLYPGDCVCEPDDCAAKGDVCDSAGACSSNAVDDLGGTSLKVGAFFFGNGIAVQSSRHLDKLEISLRPVNGDVSLNAESGMT